MHGWSFLLVTKGVRNVFRNTVSLALQGLYHKKRSNRLVFSVLLISFSFVVVSLSLVGSISKTNAEFRLNNYGEWYFAIPSGQNKDPKASMGRSCRDFKKLWQNSDEIR